MAQAVENIVRDSITDRDALEHPTAMLLTEEERPVMPVQVTKTAPVVMASQAAITKGTTVPAVTSAPMVTSAVPESQGFRSESYAQRAPIPSAPVMRSPSASADIRKYLEVDTLPPPVSSVMETKPKAPVQGEQVESFLPEAPKPMKLLGVVFNTFILVEYEDHLLMIDQHAVHERLLFDQLSKAYDQHEAGQELLIPLVVSVSRREQELLEENRNLLEGIGLSVESFGDNVISVRSLPMILGQPQAEDFIRDILDQLQSERGQVNMDKRRSSILQIACKKAVKGGDPLSEDEIRDLVSRMIDQKVTPTCPHGRPLVVAISHYELDKRFKRIQ